MENELNAIIQSSVLESSVSPKTLADEIGKPYSTLMREVNPFDHGAKLGVDTLLAIMLLTGDYSPLEYIAKSMGLKLETDAASKPGASKPGASKPQRRISASAKSAGGMPLKAQGV